MRAAGRSPGIVPTPTTIQHTERTGSVTTMDFSLLVKYAVALANGYMVAEAELGAQVNNAYCW